MKVLITGASGFIGSNLVDYFLKKGDKVIGMDYSYRNVYLLERIIPEMKKLRRMYPSELNPITKNFSMIWEDVKNVAEFYYDLEDVDIIYHLAAASDIARSADNPTYDLAENVVGTHSILELMRKMNIKKIVFPSSSAVYGEHVPVPTPENTAPLSPISQYGASKISAEAFIHAYVNVYGITAWIFRFGNIIGRNQHRGVIYDFINKLKENPKELEILGDGKQVKSYLHVSDCINAVNWIMKHDNNKSVETYNLGTYDQKTVTELTDIVCDEMNLKPKYKYKGGDRGWVGDTPIIILDIKKALSTGWKPKMKCEEAIRRTVRELVG